MHLQERIDQVKAKSETAGKRLDDHRQAAGDTWQDLMTGLEPATCAGGVAPRAPVFKP
jgi:hypothetical protein